MPEVSLGIPPFFGVKFTKEEIEQFWKVVRKVGTKREVKDLENLFGQYSKAQAESTLRVLYRQYFERDLDDSGRETYTPYILNFGFSGIMWVTYHLVQSDEMNKKVSRDLANLYRTHLHRDPDPVGIDAYDKWIRFFGKTGRQYVENSIRESDEYRGKH